MTEYEFLQVEVVDAVAVVTINRPERLNTLHPAAHVELERLWPDLEERADVGAVVLRGAGDVFSAGGDVKDMLARVAVAPDGGSGISVAQARRLVYGMLDFQKPLLAAVEGRAFGLGATLALLCDLVVAGESARFSDPHVNLGLVPGDGGIAIWTVVAGPHRARRLLMLGDAIDAAEASRLGLLADVVPDGTAASRAHDLAAALLGQPQLAVRGTKVSVNAWIKAQFASIFETSLAYEVVTLRSADFAEGLAALGEKRAPRFSGR